MLIDRDESVRYKIGRENPDDVEAILYSNGDLEISGKGSVRNFKSDSAPWKKYSVKRLTWIDPEAEVESMDYWFTGNDEYLETLCRIPDTVRSMVETFKNATAMTSMPDMSGAVRLEDITSCAEGCIALEKAMEADLAQLDSGVMPEAMDKYYGLRYKTPATLLDHLSSPIFILDEVGGIRDAQKATEFRRCEELTGLLEEGVICPGLDVLYQTMDDLAIAAQDQSTLLCENFLRGMNEFKLQDLILSLIHI